MEEENKYKKIIKLYGLYSLIFIVVAILVFLPFIIHKKSFIWKEDGLEQHFTILYNFNTNIRNKTISQFSWDIGLGEDVVGEFSYYILGDPFAYISLLFPMESLELAYNFLIVLRIYFVGLAFLTYCAYHKKKLYNSILGTIIYTFCGYVLYGSIRHPYFTNALIMLPLVFIGIDKILKENKYFVFAVTIALTAIINYYFLYVITILGIIYGLIEYICDYKEKKIKAFLKIIIKTMIAYIAGVMVAGIVLFPMIYFTHIANRDSSRNLYIVYNSIYYFSIINSIFSSHIGMLWTNFCVASIAILCIACIFIGRREGENKKLFINLCVYLVILLIPFFGYVMNGFLYPTNRWIFALDFLLAFSVVENWKEDLKYPIEYIISFCGITAFFICVSFTAIDSLKIGRSGLIILGFIVLILFLARNNIKKYYKHLIFILTISNIVGNSYYLYVTSGYVEYFVDKDAAMNIYSTMNGKIDGFEEAINTIKNNDKDYYRILVDSEISKEAEVSGLNTSLIFNYKSLNSYFSIGNKYIGKLSKEIDNSTYDFDRNALNDLDNRTRISTLLGSKYFITTNEFKENAPYGYTLWKNIGDNTLIYINENSLPLGVFYDKYITQNDYNKLSSLEKEQAILDGAVIDNKINNIDKLNSFENNIENIDFDIIDKQNEIKYYCLIENINISLDNYEFSSDKEIYVELNNLKYMDDYNNWIILEYGDHSKFKFYSETYIRNDKVLFNLGNIKELNELKITLVNFEEYNPKDIKIYAVDLNQYKDSVNKLKDNQFEIDYYDNKQIKGHINTDKSGILQFSIPYTDGWKVYVDGNKTNTFNVNTGFIGISLTNGKHDIVLKYETPFLRERNICFNFGVSIIGWNVYL